MPKYIDADEVVKALDESLKERMDILDAMKRQLLVGVIKQALSDAPVANVEPVIRCKECKFAYMTYDGECKYCDIWLEEGEMYLDGDFYCAFAERKEDEVI